jgi:excisionase family DNA binding protein
MPLSDEFGGPATLTVEEAARVLGISRGTAYKAVRAGEIPSIRIQRRLLVPRLALDRLLRALSGDDRAASPSSEAGGRRG